MNIGKIPCCAPWSTQICGPTMGNVDPRWNRYPILLELIDVRMDAPVDASSILKPVVLAVSEEKTHRRAPKQTEIKDQTR